MSNASGQSTAIPGPVLEDLADTLWQERHMVELLLFKLVTAKLLLAADEHRFVGAAVDEVTEVVEALRGAEGRRVAALQSVADRLEIPVEDLTLSEVVRRAPAPMNHVFRDHRDAFLGMTREIEETASANRQLASAALGRVRRSLDALTGASPVTTYNAAGTTVPTPGGAARLDAAL
jgi:hypothetical protein